MILETTLKLLFWLGDPVLRRYYARSWPIEGTYEHKGPGETLYWCLKRCGRSVELPEAGQGIEERFRPLPAKLEDGHAHFEAPEQPAGVIVTSRARVTCVGDLVPSKAVNQADIAHLLDDTAPEFARADLVCANLESPVAPARPVSDLPPKTWRKPLHLNHDPAFAGKLLGGPLRLVSLANNHTLDQGIDGLIATMDFLDERGCAYVGVARSPRDQARPQITELAGIRVAHIAWTFSLSNKQRPPGGEYFVNYLRLNQRAVDLTPLTAQVRAARAAGAEIVVAHLHWGLEYEAYPNQALIDNAHRVIEAGVDVIVGNHPHHVQPWEWHSYIPAADADRPGPGTRSTPAQPAGLPADADQPGPATRSSQAQRTGLIIYALGDFASFQRGLAPANYLAGLAGIDLAKGRDAAGGECAWVAGLQVTPLAPFARFRGRRCREFRMLDLTRLAANGFNSALHGWGGRHRRLARTLWDSAARARLR
ncbi:MAG: CapA family protein [Bifidobacteriaceae bacterium]|nr:CapA family protein [Bifidobacteriaceae bacterium]